MKSGKRETTEGIELQNKERIKTFGEKVNYKYLCILGTDTIKQREREREREKERKKERRKECYVIDR